MKPVRIRRESPSALGIEWDDGHKGTHSMQSLRDHCPCATCRTERESHEGRVVLPILTPGKYDLKNIEPVGNYALQLAWGDGHRTGIYTFQFLRQMCECDACTRTARA